MAFVKLMISYCISVTVSNPAMHAVHMDTPPNVSTRVYQTKRLVRSAKPRRSATCEMRLKISAIE